TEDDAEAAAEGETEDDAEAAAAAEAAAEGEGETGAEGAGETESAEETAAVAATAAARAAQPEVPGLAEARALIAKKRWSSAEKRLQELRKKHPDSGEIPYLLGNLYMRKMWWEHGIDNYRLAIKNDPSYRENATLIRYVIQNLQSPSKSWLGRRFLLQEIGAPALPHLEAAGKSGANSTIRKRARDLHAQLKKRLGS
ncbi:MAG TPA: hypothetical protein VKZ63_15885, partial [Kofleriaceae bacterium]|nr:hypothetical protein [Kofleriaceae bacterium]